MPRFSKIWNHFVDNGDNDPQCKICKKCMKSSKNTTNMLKHLKTNHRIVYDEHTQTNQQYEAIKIDDFISDINSIKGKFVASISDYFC